MDMGDVKILNTDDMEAVEMTVFYNNILTGIQKVVEKYNVTEVSYDSNYDRQTPHMNGLDLHLILENETCLYDDLSTDEIAELKGLSEQSLEKQYGEIRLSHSMYDDPLQEYVRSIDISLVDHNPEYLELLRDALHQNLKGRYGFEVEQDTKSAVMGKTGGSQTSEQS